jgi:beta-hydroxylase
MSQLTDKNPCYFYPSSAFPRLKILESKFDEIREELLAALDNVLIDQWLVAFPDYVKSDEKKAWKTFTFLFFQMKSDHHRKLCPKTAAILDELPEIISCDFSVMKAKTHILPHKGYSKMVLRCHLPLIIPDTERCALRVGDETHHWEEGKLVIFDDSFDHEAWNHSDALRAVLMFDIPNPLWGYSADDIARFKLENLTDPFLLSIASKEEWLNAFHQKKLPFIQFS